MTEQHNQEESRNTSDYIERLGEQGNRVLKIFKKYANDMKGKHPYSIKWGDNISKKSLNGALSTYALGTKENSVIGLYDTTLFDNGKAGFLFTEAYFCHKDTLEKPMKVWYADIEDVEVLNMDKKDADRTLKLSVKTEDGNQTLTITNFSIDKTPLRDFLLEVKEISEKKKSLSPEAMRILELLKTNANEIFADSLYPVSFGANISNKQLRGALSSYAVGVDAEAVLALYDTTLFGNGQGGFLFTEFYFCYKETFEKPQKIWYDDIEKIELIKTSTNDNENKLLIVLNEREAGQGKIISETNINKEAFKQFLLAVSNVRNIQEEVEYKFSTEKMEADSEVSLDDLSGAQATNNFYGGIGLGNSKIVNQLTEEELFAARQGHGIAAEHANNVRDRLQGRDAKVIGGDNVKNGADRIVNGQLIQTKYCQTGAKCIKECFDHNGNFRYIVNGKPMQIEVPKDMYDDALQAMRNRIQKGEIPGVTDPNDANKYVRKGHVTYQQAKNIAKGGNIDSLIYDAQTGIITATSVFGLSAVVSFAQNVWEGEDFEVAIRESINTGLQIGGTTFFTHILSEQSSNLFLNKALVGVSEGFVKNVVGTKGAGKLVKILKISNSNGNAAVKALSKHLRNNVIVSGATIVVMSTGDIIDIFSGKISSTQLLKNVTGTVSTVTGGTVGWFAGTVLLPFVPGSGLIGSVIGGQLGGKMADAALEFLPDDAEALTEIIQQQFITLSEDYMLNRKEAEKSADRLRDKLTGKTLKEMFASEDKVVFANNILEPIVEAEVKKRPHIPELTEEQVLYGMELAFEEMADQLSEFGDNVDEDDENFEE